MNLFTFGVVGSLIAQGMYLINGDKKLKKQIDASAGRKQWKTFSQKVLGLNQEVIHKVQEIDYEEQWNTIKTVAHEKEKDLQKHIKKLQGYADSLGEKKLKEIIDDIQASSKSFIDKIQTSSTPSAKMTKSTKKTSLKSKKKK